VGGGDFELWVLGGLACGEEVLSRWRLAGCLGAEAARVRGEGAGANVLQSHSRAAWVPALRAEAGVGLALTQAFSAWLRLGASLPLAHPQFVLGDSAQVHEVPNLAARGALELALRF
jgi:hypothetical protein